MLIGEREFIRFKLGAENQQLYKQIDEMSETITKLRAEIAELKNGKLGKPDHH